MPQGAPALRDYALTLADIADRITLSHFGGRVPAEAKGDGSPVTAADREVESALRERIATTFPGHAILGEEQGGRIEPSVPTWVIDPIDATKNFMRGVPVFATLIGVVAEGRSVMGVVSAPAMGERWDAAAGQGTRRNGEAIRVSDIDRIEDAHVLHGGLKHLRHGGMWPAVEALADRAWRTRGFGDFWMSLLVAGGMAEAAIELGPNVWDVAALECIVTEAGGALTRFDGGSVLTDNPRGEVLATNGRIDAAMRELLATA